jgi:electron transfer flavoprotein beta subunit
LAVKLTVNGNTATVEREVVGGEEVIEVATPFVVSAAKGMAEQRIPNMRGIMAARTKPLTVVPAATAEASTAVKNYTLPPAKSGCKYIDAENAGSLIQLLHEEAKAI